METGHHENGSLWKRITIKLITIEMIAFSPFYTEKTTSLRNHLLLSSLTATALDPHCLIMFFILRLSMGSMMKPL